MRVLMQKSKETKGALMYTELDDDRHQVATVSDGLIGQLYLRKRSEIGKAAPEFITVEVNAEAKAEAPKTPKPKVQAVA